MPASSVSALELTSESVFSRARSKPAMPGWLVFALMAVLFVARNPFPSLYGDEYGSLREAANWGLNPHAIGYFVQLRFWRYLGESDLFLRSLSMIWMALGMYWFNRWLAQEQFSPSARRWALILAAANPFLWKYGTQVRFYSLFFAATVLTMWRFRVWQQQPVRKNVVWLSLSSLLLCAAHLFGWLVMFALVASAFWERWPRIRWILFAGGAVVFLVVLVPPVTHACTAVVYALTNSHAQVPHAGARGLSLAMWVKIPFTFFVFMLGERVYPLWWWISIPGTALCGIALWCGLRRREGCSGMKAVAVFTLISAMSVFLVLDPLAPGTLQGAGPRYVIYALPVVLLMIGWGAEGGRWLMLGVMAAELLGLACMLWPTWSFDYSDSMNWDAQLTQAARTPAQTCVVTDGRARAPVERYAPAGSRILSHDQLQQLSACETVVLASNDYQLEMTRWLDDVSSSLQTHYELTSNGILFPAQVSVYRRSVQGLTTFTPSRLGLVEQDLQQGFVRLDGVRGTAQVAPPPSSRFLIATDFRSDRPLPRGTPVMTLRFRGPGFARETTLRAGFETAAWDGACASCESLGGWTKRAHLLGAKAYPGAYRQYRATIWGAPLASLPGPVTSAEVTTLLREGTVYFFGFYESRGIAR